MSTLEPSRITLGERTFTVHYIQAIDANAPLWCAFTHVVRFPNGQLWPAEGLELPVGYQPPAVQGQGASHLEAFAHLQQNLQRDLSEPYVPGRDPTRPRPIEPYVTHLPAPAEAILGGLQWVDQNRASLEGTSRPAAALEINALEAPSSRLAFQMGVAAIGLPGFQLTLKVTRLQSPDPRLPRRPVQYQVWRYREDPQLPGRRLGTEPESCVPPPPASVRAAVAQIAWERGWEFDRSRWFAAAREVSRSVRPTVEHLLGVMSHPAEAPGWRVAALVLQRVQVAAALVLAQMDREVPWSRSLRRQVLLDLAEGPLDWTNGAALIALTALAQEEPEIGPELISLFEGLLRNLHKPGHVCYHYALVCCMQQLPGLDPAWKAHLAQYQRQMEEADRQSG